MPLRYRCLVVDHDDTSVRSTESIHYPAHVEAIRRLRPETQPIGFEGFLSRNSNPGLLPFLTEELGLSREEIAESYDIWRQFTSSRVPEFFPGLLEIYAEFVARGGLLVVASHSETDMIERDYRVARASGPSVQPNLIYGWDEDPSKRKPAPYPVLEAMRRLGLSEREILVLDDLKPGADMAAASGVDFAAAGWGHSIPDIREELSGLCDYYLERVDDLRALLFA